MKWKNSGIFCVNMLFFVICIDGMGSIFDNCDVVMFVNGVNGVNICWCIGIMYWNDGFSVWCNGWFDSFRCDY